MIDWIYFVVFIAMIILFWQYIQIRGMSDSRAMHMFPQRRSEELEREAVRLAGVMCEECGKRRSQGFARKR